MHAKAAQQLNHRSSMAELVWTPLHAMVKELLLGIYDVWSGCSGSYARHSSNMLTSSSSLQTIGVK